MPHIDEVTLNQQWPESRERIRAANGYAPVLEELMAELENGWRVAAPLHRIATRRSSRRMVLHEAVRSTVEIHVTDLVRWIAGAVVDLIIGQEADPESDFESVVAAASELSATLLILDLAARSGGMPDAWRRPLERTLPELLPWSLSLLQVLTEADPHLP